MPSQFSNTIPANCDPHLFTVQSAAQFAKVLKQGDECYCFMLNFTHHLTHGSKKFAEVNWNSEQMLNELEKEYLAVFSEPAYPIWEHK